MNQLEPHRWRTLGLCTLLHGFTHVYQVALIPLYLLIGRDFKLAAESEATFLVTVMALAYFLPSYGMGILADRTSRKNLLALGLAINGLGFVGLSLAPSYGMAIASVILAGLGGSFFHPAATALVAQLFPEHTGKALGRMGIGAAVGFCLGPLYAGWRAGTTGWGGLSGWRLPVLELGLLGLVGAGVFLRLAHEHANPVSDHHHKQSGGRLFASPLLWIFFLLSALFFCLRDFAGSGMASLGSLFMQHAHGFTARQAGLALCCLYAASVVSNPLFGGLSDRNSLRWTTLVLIVAALLIFIFPHVPAWGVIPVLACFGFFFMASYPMVEAALMHCVPPSMRGRAFGIWITIGGMLGNLSHWVVGGWVNELGGTAGSVTSYHPLFNGLALCVALSLGGLAFLHGLRKRPQPRVQYPLEPQPR